jgi:ankyrin repeat protein
VGSIERDSANWRTPLGNVEPSMSLSRIFEEGTGAVVFNLLKTFPEERTTDLRYAHILQMAAFLGHLPFVELLIERGVHVNSVVEYYGTALQAASRCGHADTVKALLNAGAQVNTISGTCKTALRAALKGGHVGTVQLLLENGASIDILPDGEEMSDLHMAIDGDNPSNIDLLLAAGADPNSGHHPNGFSALQVAYDNRNVKIMKRLLCAGAKLDTLGTRSLLYWACQAGHTDIAKLLLEHGADVNAETKFGGYGPIQSEFVTPLMAAARSGRIKCVSLLLESGASVTTPALVAAIKCSRSQPLQMLLDHLESHGEIPEQASLVACLRKLDGTNRSSGSSRNLGRGEVPSVGVQAQKLALLTEYEVPQGEVFLAVCRLETETMVRTILAQGINLAEDGLGLRAVRIVALKLNDRLLSLLLQHGAVAECHTPEPNYVPVVQSVLHENLSNDLYSMKWNARYIPHVQPNTLASLVKVITLLLDNGANVNGSSGDMGTPLQLAALIGSTELVRRMLDAGADIHEPGPVNAPAPGGKMFANALQAAEKGGHLEVVDMLKSAGALNTADEGASSSSVVEYTSEEDV